MLWRLHGVDGGKIAYAAFCYGRRQAHFVTEIFESFD
jgi:hypothetical protein